MPRLPTLPDTCEEKKRLEIAYLVRYGLLSPGHHSASIRWRNRSEVTGTLGIVSFVSPEGTGYLRLSYCDETDKRQDCEIKLVSVVSNLPGSTSRRYYLICPLTGRRASILYHRDDAGLFTHRDALPGHPRVYYESQLVPKRFRGLAKFLTVDRVWEEQYRKGRKTTYRGQPTKWYASLLTLESRAAEAAAPAIRGLAAYRQK